MQCLLDYTKCIHFWWLSISAASQSKWCP